MQEIESKIYTNNDLLNITQSTINLSSLNENINNIELALYMLDPVKDSHKYLCLSCIFGAFLGDSIGSCCEFSFESSDNHTHIFEYENGIFRPGEVTDDSEMAMSAAFAYIDILNENPSIIQNIIYYYYCIWRTSGPKDIGGATSSALRFWDESSITETKFINQLVRTYNWDSLANGFLMRISTFITYYYYTNTKLIYETIINYFNQPENMSNLSELPDYMIKLYQSIYIESYKNVEITHPNYENGVSSAVFTLMTLVGMVTKDAKKVYTIFNQIAHSKKFIECHGDMILKKYAAFVQQKYLQIINDIVNNYKISVYSQMGYYLHGFKLSVYYLYKYPDMGENKDIDLYYKIMCDVCDYGGDTDTNCAIVGAMIGPLIGYKNFKTDLFERFIKFVPDMRCQYTSAFMYVYVNYLEDNLLNDETKKKIEEMFKIDKSEMPMDIEEKKDEIKNEEGKMDIIKNENQKEDDNKNIISNNNNQEENKPVENKQEENKPVENKQEENKQIENKKEESKPVENKQEENKPIENKQEENKPVENKPIENKQEENKQEEKNKEENKPEENKLEENKNEIKGDNKPEEQKNEIKEEKKQEENKNEIKDEIKPEIKENKIKEENQNEKNVTKTGKKEQIANENQKEKFKYTAIKLILKFLNEKMDF